MLFLEVIVILAVLPFPSRVYYYFGMVYLTKATECKTRDCGVNK